MRASILAAVVGLALARGHAHAQPAVAMIDEATLVAELEAKDPRAAVAAAKLADARADVAAARVRPNPTISIEREEPFVGGTGLATNYLRLSVPFDISGRRGRQIEAAQAGVRAVDSDATQAKLELVIQALRVFDDAARARLHVEILTSSRTSLVRAVEIARKRGKAGDASGYEIQRFELELAGHDDDLATAQIDLARARGQLAALTGRTGELDASSTLDLPAAVPTVETLLAKANGRGDLRAARLRGEAANRRAGAAGRGWVPTPTLTAGAMTVDLGDQTATGYVAGVALTIPVFDRGQGDKARADADRQLAIAEARWLERQIPSAVQVAHTTLMARIEQTRRLATGQLDRLDVILVAAETAFREGNASVIELLDAHRAARGVRTRALDLRHQVARDKRELELAVGQRL
ncbi:MAG: TolC family protein [Deltaproteobacteria bacterium]|nr:TolC family protein [Deltaproteobacteria bacterium]